MKSLVFDSSNSISPNIKATSIIEPLYEAFKLEKRELNRFTFNNLEGLYSQHVNSINNLNISDIKDVKQSFYNYINYVFDTFQLKKPDNFEIDFAIERGSSKSSSKVHVDSRKGEINHPMDPKPISGEEFYEMMKKSTDVIIFRTFMLKIMYNEPILMEDLKRFTESKLFNLQKLVFVKFKRVIDIKFDQ